MLYSYIDMATVGVKGLIQGETHAGGAWHSDEESTAEDTRRQYLATIAILLQLKHVTEPCQTGLHSTHLHSAHRHTA